MQFALLVKSHANARYAQSLLKLATLECECLLFALNLQAEVRLESLAGTPFLIVETAAMDDADWAYLCRHSAISLAAVRDGEWLRPLPLKHVDYLEPDLAQVLKYKGKTNADFTAMMLHCARSASAFAHQAEPLVVLDPVCGRATTLFCALQEGDCATGIDEDDKALHEADTYFTRYLQYHRYKHRRQEQSITLRAGGQARERRFTLADSAQAMKQGQTLELRLIHGDTTRAAEMLSENSCHLVVGDLPYGVQHAPREGRGVGTLTRLMEGALPAYRSVLKPGGAIALSFNTYTLPRETLCALLRRAGFNLLEDPPFNDFAHWVEQAVNRDMVIARK